MKKSSKSIHSIRNDIDNDMDEDQQIRPDRIDYGFNILKSLNQPKPKNDPNNVPKNNLNDDLDNTNGKINEDSDMEENCHKFDLDEELRKKYTSKEWNQIVSTSNRKILTEQIKSLQKPEWIEVFRIIRNGNETKSYQENKSGIWIVMNKLKESTIVKLHQFTKYRLENRRQLKRDKINFNNLKENLKKDFVKNDTKLIQKSSLLHDESNGEIVEHNGTDNISNLHGDIGSNLKTKINIKDASKLSPDELDDMLSERLLARMNDDSVLQPSQMVD